MTRDQVDVLVVGAGPSGLFAAVDLARHGVLARVVEREPQPHRQARATALQPGTLEILARAEVLDEVLASSMHLTFARVFDRELTQASEMRFAGAGCRWEYQCSLPQWRTEQILADRLSSLGVAIERGVSASSVEPRADGVRVTLERADGSKETVETRYAIGAGGAHSVTRTTMAGGLGGDTYPGTALAADVRVRCGLPRDGGALIATPEGYVLLAPLPDDWWLTFIGDLYDEEIDRLEHDRSADTIAGLLSRRITGKLELVDVDWASRFQMHRRIASRLAGERWFLLGDAGHLSSPFGGEGLNSGLHDGHNLAWKLALTVRGLARPALLHSFEPERLIADRQVLEVSDRLHGLAHAAVEAARSGVRPAPPTTEQVAALVRERSMLDITYAGGPLLGEYLAPGAPPPPDPEPGDRFPDQISPRTSHRLLLFGAADDDAAAGLRQRWAGLVDVAEAGTDGRRTGAVLIRPDGYVSFRANATDAPALAAIEQHLDSYLIAS
jgi:6-methylpretetramide 4-monooxygenase / 4-hydroxy-6-methylpretetramide 12a-monooxygenase